MGQLASLSCMIDRFQSAPAALTGVVRYSPAVPATATAPAPDPFDFDGRDQLHSTSPGMHFSVPMAEQESMARQDDGTHGTLAMQATSTQGTMFSCFGTTNQVSATTQGAMACTAPQLSTADPVSHGPVVGMATNGTAAAQPEAVIEQVISFHPDPGERIGDDSDEEGEQESSRKLPLTYLESNGSITNAPPDIEACVGDDVNIPWTYDDNDGDITSVIWYNGANVDIMFYFGSGGSHTATNSYNVVNHGNGNITLNNVPIGYTDAYKIDVTAVSNSEDVVDVTVCSASSGQTYSKSGDTITCEATDLGTPAAVLRIWIDGTGMSTSSATVTDSNEVSCCIYGCAVKCMNGGSSSDSSSCILVQGH